MAAHTTACRAITSIHFLAIRWVVGLWLALASSEPSSQIRPGVKTIQSRAASPVFLPEIHKEDTDILYFLNKMQRGFDQAIYILGADHHGYIARLQAAAIGLGEDPDRLEIILVQFAVLYRNGVKVAMSTRSGQFITLRELREEVGSDAARYFYIMRSHEQHLDFDLDLAKSNSNENPVYYIQYAHARICSVFRNLEQMDETHNQAIGEAALKLLIEPNEIKLLRALSRYPEIIESAARLRAPHQLAHYLQALATEFHALYNSQQFLVDDENIRNTRLNLILATRIVLANGLALLGISAPESM